MPTYLFIRLLEGIDVYFVAESCVCYSLLLAKNAWVDRNVCGCHPRYARPSGC